MRFQDQVVIVTGASRGIGRGIANFFAKEGARLVLVGRDEAQLQKVASELGALYVIADVRNAQDMERVAAVALEHYGRIGVLCCNAGIFPQTRLENMNPKQWQEVIDINLTGTFLTIHACLPAMKAQKSGRIVVTSSISGPLTGLPGYAHYTASKAGMEGLVRTAALELAKYNITANAVEPGNILTEGLEAMGQEHVHNMIKAIPMGRLGSVEEVGYAIAFLASKEASFITGQSLVIDGGQTLPESHFSEY